ncbi:MAG: cupin domain-containing protein [Comamonadaceae bacterium]|nr:MAG: cupin domain-containing protein [Comamonadaceae bacterium]
MSAQTFRPSPRFEAAKDLPSLYEMLDQVGMKNGWAKPTPSMYGEPKAKFVPAHWRFDQARAALHAAGSLVATEWAERRNLIMANPIEGNDFPTVNSLVAAYQMVKGGETARSHRHTPNAMRLVLEAASETYTIVEGRKIPMCPGDLLLTPSGQYHGHSNESNSEAYWIDILDVPSVHLLGPMFFEIHPEVTPEGAGTDEASAMRIAFAAYRPALAACAPVLPGIRTLELAPDAIATFDRVAVQLDAGARWDVQKSTASEIWVAVEGSGVSHVGADEFAWARGDIVAVPFWTESSHSSSAGAVLVRMSDRPMLSKLGWLRTQAAKFQS